MWYFKRLCLANVYILSFDGYVWIYQILQQLGLANVFILFINGYLITDGSDLSFDTRLIGKHMTLLIL